MNDKITRIPINSKRPRGKGPISIVDRNFLTDCQHKSVVVDDKLLAVECADCKAKLNPISVLVMLANEDWRLRERWRLLSAQVRTLSSRTRCKCDHCGKLTRIPSAVSDLQLRIIAEQIEKEEQP